MHRTHAAVIVAAALTTAAMAQPLGDPPADAARPAVTDPGIPDVRSREDYFNLTQRERERFNRARRGPVNAFLDLRGDFILGADARGRAGEVAIYRTAASVGPSFKLSDKTDFAVQFQTEHSFYNFQDARGFIQPGDTAAEPFDNAQLLAITPAINHVDFDGFSYVAGARFASFGEIDADFSETLTVGGFFIGSYQVTSNLRIGMGVNVASELSSDDQVFFAPIPVFIWNITDELTFGTDRGAVRLAYRPSYAWEFALESDFQRREFRLAEDAALPNGVVIDRAIPVNLAASFNPHPRFNLTARLGAHVWGDFEFFDENDAKVSDIERDPAFFAGVELQLRF